MVSIYIYLDRTIELRIRISNILQGNFLPLRHTHKDALLYMKPGIIDFPVLIRRKRQIEISENLRNNLINFLQSATSWGSGVS